MPNRLIGKGARIASRAGEKQRLLARREQGTAAVQVQVAFEQQRIAAFPGIEEKFEAQGLVAQGPCCMEFGAHKGKTLQEVRQAYSKKCGKEMSKEKSLLHICKFWSQ